MLIPSNKIAEESCHSKKDEANPLWQFCISYTFEENLSVLITPTITAPREALNPGINDLWLVQLNLFLSPSVTMPPQERFHMNHPALPTPNQQDF